MNKKVISGLIILVITIIAFILSTDTVSATNQTNQTQTEINRGKINRHINYYNSNVSNDIAKQISNKIVTECAKYNINPLIVSGQIKKESTYYQDAKGKDAKGLMQISSDTAKFIAKELGKTKYDLYNINDNIEMGVWYLNYCIEIWENKKITQIHPKTGKKMTAWQMGLLTYNGGTSLASKLKNIKYLYGVEAVMKKE